MLLVGLVFIAFGIGDLVYSVVLARRVPDVTGEELARWHKVVRYIRLFAVLALAIGAVLVIVD